MDKRLTGERSNCDFQSSKQASTNSLDSDSKSSSLNSKHGVDTMVIFPIKGLGSLANSNIYIKTVVEYTKI